MAIKFRATIRDTPASLRFGAEIPSVTLDVCPADEASAVALIALKKTALTVLIEIDDGKTNEADNQEESGGEAKGGKGKGTSGRSGRNSTKIHI